MLSASRPANPFRPRSRRLALEPRVLFDGAAAVAVEQQAGPESHAEAPAAHATTIVAIDSRVTNAAQLAQETAKDGKARVVMVGAGEDGLTVISKVLAEEGSVEAIQIYSHGAAGQFTLGSRNVSADNVAAAKGETGKLGGASFR